MNLLVEVYLQNVLWRNGAGEEILLHYRLVDT